MHPYDPSNPITSLNIILYIGKHRLEIRKKGKKQKWLRYILDKMLQIKFMEKKKEK